MKSSGLILVLFLVIVVKARVIYVSVNGVDFVGCGEIATPCQTINYAIEETAQFDTVTVLPGDYYLTSTLLFFGRGITLNSQDGEESTKIYQNCSNCRAMEITQGDFDRPPSISGFTFDNWNFPNSFGSAISITEASPSISNCTFSNNKAFYGGAVYIQNSNCTFNNCKFYQNSAGASGGAVSISPQTLSHDGQDKYAHPSFYQCLFYSNYAKEGGSILSSSSANFSYCNFFDHNLSKQTSNLTISDFQGGIISVPSLYSVYFEYCDFNNNTAYDIPGTGLIFYVSGNVIASYCSFTNNILNNTFTNTGAVFSLTQSAIIDISSSTFHNNSAGYGGLGGCLFANMFSQSTFRNCTFTSNSALMGGCFYASNGLGEIESQITTTITDCNLLSNRAAFGGAIYILGRNVNLFLSNTILSDNEASSGGGMYVTGVISGFHLHNSTLTNNRATIGTGGAIYFVNCIQELYDLFFSENLFRKSTEIVIIEDSPIIEVDISNCTFSQNYSFREGGALSLTASALVFSFTDCIFESNTASSAGSIYAFDIGNITISSSTFISCRATENDGGALSLEDIPHIHIESCLFDNNTASSSGGGILISHASSNIINCLFSHNDASASGGAISYSITAQTTQFQSTIESSNFTSNSIINHDETISGGSGGGSLNFEFFVGTISNVILTDNYADGNGGAIRIVGISNLNITSMICKNNVARGNGGCIVNSGITSSFSCSDCNITNNFSSSFGGGVSATNLTSLSGELIDNIASVGGATYLESQTADLSLVLFMRNYAMCYGNDKASQIQSIIWLQPPPTGIPPEIEFFEIETVLLDAFDQQVRCLNEFIEIKLSSTVGSTLLGELSQIATINGITEFPNLRILGDFGSNYTITATLKYNSNDTSNIYTTTEVQILPCPPGYLQNNVLQTCQECPAGTYNTNGDGICLTCPKGGICVGGFQVYADVGYWRETADLENVHFYYCPERGNCCPEGFCTVDNPCTSNRQGTLCSECKPGFSEWGGVCASCEGVDWIIILILFIISCLFVSWMVLYPFAYWGLPNAILYFIQTSPLLMSSSSPLAQLLNTFNLQFDLTQKIVTLFGEEMCLFPVNEVTKLLIPFLIPTLFCLALITVWLISSIYKFYKFKTKYKGRKRFTEIWEKHTNLFILGLGNIFNFAYLSITVTCLNILVPAWINGEMVIGASPSVYYFDKGHLMVAALALFILSFFSIGFPIVIVARVNKLYNKYYSPSALDFSSFSAAISTPSVLRIADDIHRTLSITEASDNMYSTKSKTYQRYGPFYFGFKPKFRYWKSVVFAQRAILATLFVTLMYVPSWQAILMSFWCIAMSTVHSFVWPWRSQLVNITETICLFCLSLLSSLKVSYDLLTSETTNLFILSTLIVFTPIAWVIVTLSYKGVHKFRSKMRKMKEKREERNSPMRYQPEDLPLISSHEQE